MCGKYCVYKQYRSCQLSFCVHLLVSNIVLIQITCTGERVLSCTPRATGFVTIINDATIACIYVHYITMLGAQGL